MRSIAKKYGARCESRFSPEAKLKQKVARLTGLAETSIAEAERHLDEEDPLAARRALLNANRLLSKATAVSPKAQVAALRARITAVREAHRTELARAETFEADPRVLELRRQLQRIADAHLIAERNHSRLADKRLSGCDPNLADCDDHRAENAYANEVERLDEDYAAAKANLDQLREQLGL